MTYLADLPADLLARAARVRLAVFDVDGTLTDGRLYYGNDGSEAKAFHVRDGLGLKRLSEHGIAVALVTARRSALVERRAQELGIAHLHQGRFDKRACLDELAAATNLSADQVAWTGDDLPDLPPMRSVGLAVAVADAHPWVLEAAHWRTTLGGGEGAAREVCDLLIEAQGKCAAEREHWR